MRKTDRNDPCSCGSGKKDKQCSLQPEVTQEEETQPVNSSVDQMIQVAVNYHQENRLFLAEAVYRRILQIEPNHLNALHLLGVLARQKGQHLAAIELLRRVLMLKPDFAEAHSNLGNTFKAQGMLAEAVASYNKALALKPDYVDAHYNLGNTLRAQGKLDEAVSSYHKALELKPNYVEAHGNLGIALQKQGKLDEAIACYRKALVLNPEYVESHYNLGYAYQEKGELNEAVLSYNKALALRPDFFEGHGNLGIALQKQGKLEDAIERYHKALALKPDFAEAHYNLGIALKEKGALDEAVLSYNKALAHKPDYVEANFNLGNSLKAQGKLNEAINAFQRALTLAPKSHSGLESAVKLAVLHYLRNDFQRAAQLIEIANPLKEKSEHQLRSSKAYLRYVDNLLRWWDSAKESFAGSYGSETLHVIGDSHCLSAHRCLIHLKDKNFQCKADWIEGCKQWHLGNPYENQYKYVLAARMKSLPPNATILLTIGEIDCRPNEGVFKVWQESRCQAIEQIAMATVEGYLNHVAEVAAAHKHRIIICGVPATNAHLESLTAEEKIVFIHMLSVFNTILRKHSLDMGMDFLDVYTMTNFGNGLANKLWHLDDYHLRPDAYGKAFENHYLRGNFG